MKEGYLKVWMVLAPFVFGVSYFITDRVNLRIQQLKEQNMHAATGGNALIYASIVTVVFSLIYYFVARDLSRNADDDL